MKNQEDSVSETHHFSASDDPRTAEASTAKPDIRLLCSNPNLRPEDGPTSPPPFVTKTTMWAYAGAEPTDSFETVIEKLRKKLLSETPDQT